MRLLKSSLLKSPRLHTNFPLKSSFNSIDSIFASTTSFDSIPIPSFNPSFNSFQLADFVNAWSINGSTLASSDTASNLFSISLIPYLIFLYLISRPVTKTPKVAIYGFQFLLVFVFATIPAGIIAKVQYNDILANVDYLHGIAESLLTITNLLIINGFLNNKEKNNESSVIFNDSSYLLFIPMLLSGLIASPHIEPTNALSIPTWIVHTSSILEWYIAMTLVWKQADISNNPRWKDLTWGMLPAHASGICACTFHLFYNSVALYWLVGLQALLTVIGNTTLALGAYRIYDYEVNNSNDREPSLAIQTSNKIENNSQFWINNIIKCVVSAIIIKYGELFFDFPFEKDSNIAAGIVIGATALVGGLFYIRDKK